MNEPKQKTQVADISYRDSKRLKPIKAKWSAKNGWSANCTMRELADSLRESLAAIERAIEKDAQVVEQKINLAKVREMANA